MEAFKRATILGLSVMCAGPRAGGQAFDVHSVRAGETLSSIARQYFGVPIYKPETGSLARLLKLNPQIQNAHVIFPGQSLFIAESVAPELREPSAAEATVPPTRESVPPVAPPNAPEDREAEAAKEAPMPVPASTNEEKDPRHRLGIGVASGLTTFDAEDRSNGSRASLVTNHDVAVDAAWSQDWTSTFSTSFGAGFRHVEFQPPTSGSKSLQSATKFLSRVSFGLENEFSRRLSLRLDAAYSSELFLRASTASVLAFDAVPLPSLGGELEYALVTMGRTSISAVGGGRYWFPGNADSYSIDKGTTWRTGLRIQHLSRRGKGLTGTIAYEERRGDTSITHYKESGVSAGILFSWPLFEGEAEE